MRPNKKECKENALIREKVLLKYLSLLEIVLEDLRFTTYPHIYRSLRVESVGAGVHLVADEYVTYLSNTFISPTIISLRIFGHILFILKSDKDVELLQLLSSSMGRDAKMLFRQSSDDEHGSLVRLTKAMKVFNDCFETDLSKVRKVVSERFERDKKNISWLKGISCSDDELVKRLDSTISNMSAIREIMK